MSPTHHRAIELEQSYDALLAAMDYGFCVIDVMFDAAGNPVDYRYLETNPAFEKQSGLTGATGHTIKELVTDIEPFWLQVYGDVARTGTPHRAQHQVAALHRWFETHAFRIGAAGSTSRASCSRMSPTRPASPKRSASAPRARTCRCGWPMRCVNCRRPTISCRPRA
jgi:PAS domain-containing protein